MFYRTAAPRGFQDENGNYSSKISRCTPPTTSLGVSQDDKQGNWRTRSNQRPLVINRNATIDTRGCL